MTQLVVPAYFHPTARPDDWARLVDLAAHIRAVVLNIASGPGTAPDEAFDEPLAALFAAGVDVVGYVDTNYGRRAPADALAEVRKYRNWYGVTGVMFDRVSAGAEHVRPYARLVADARAVGARTVGFNHGTHPVENYADHADLLGTFEGPWPVYAASTIPRWVRARPADRFFHLVYALPSDRLQAALALLRTRHAANGCLTNQGGANPWRCLSAELVGATT